MAPGIILFSLKYTLMDNFRGKKYNPFVFVIFTSLFLEYGGVNELKFHPLSEPVKDLNNCEE